MIEDPHVLEAIRRYNEGFWDDKFVRDRGCINWTGATRGQRGFGEVAVRVNGIKKVFYVHSIVYAAKTHQMWPTKETKQILKHVCHNSKCCNINHLVLRPRKGSPTLKVHCKWKHKYPTINHIPIQFCQECINYIPIARQRIKELLDNDHY